MSTRHTRPQSVPIDGEMIRLGQFLKWAGAVDDGAMAREVIAAGQVTVDGDVCRERGRQLRAGAVVGFAGEEFLVGDDQD